jgi:hypothetical protein
MAWYFVKHRDNFTFLMDVAERVGIAVTSPARDRCRIRTPDEDHML